MYQALYRKWRPRTFDDVVGQSHITDTLKQQVAGDRLSHAYLFTGTRGTGKTTCAKILARAVNCQNPQNGNPCNQCPACLGIENGSILDVLELDAASNNGVDQVRALRDEAVYTPAAVRKRVYIVDEVHMLSTPAFNALLKILEEPPAHLMFILATTELHKVPATIKSRCQQFSFKRILPGQIAQRLDYVAQQEGIDLTREGAALLARLADGGLRDALSLLDQCSGGQQRVDEQEILDTLGLAGNLETAALMSQIADHQTAQALETLARLYGNGKDVGSVLNELSALARDLLLRKTAPQGCGALLTGGYDEATMRSLGERFTAQRLLQVLTVLQAASTDLARSSNRRTDAELCLIRLCDETLDESFAGLSARIARLEERMAQGIPAQAAPVQTVPAPNIPAQRVSAPNIPAQAAPAQPDLPPWDMDDGKTTVTAPTQGTPTDLPPWEEEERPPLPEEPPEEREMDFMEPPPRRSPPPPPPPRPDSPPPAPPPRPNPPPPPRPTPPPPNAPFRRNPPPRMASTSEYAPSGDRTFWPSFAAGLKGKVSPIIYPYLNNPAKVAGVWKNGQLTLWVDSEFTRTMLNKQSTLDGLKQAAAASFGGDPKVSIVTGKPPVEAATPPVQPASPATASSADGTSTGQKPEVDALDELIAFAEQYDNIIIQ